MGDSVILKMICRVGIFIICAQTIMHIKPKGSYEQYFKLLVSVMLLVQILQPISELFTQNGELDLESRIEQIQKELKQNMELSGADILVSQKILENMALEEADKYLQEEENTQEHITTENENTKVIPQIAPIESIKVECKTEAGD